MRFEWQERERFKITQISKSNFKANLNDNIYSHWIFGQVKSIFQAKIRPLLHGVINKQVVSDKREENYKVGTAHKN